MKNVIQTNAFEFRLTFCLAMLTALVLYVGYLRDNSSSALSEAELARILFSGLVVIGIVYSILTFEFNVSKTRQDRKTALSKTTFDILSAWYGIQLTAYSKTVYEFENSEKYPLLKNNLDAFKVWYNSSNKDAVEVRAAVGGILKYFEAVAAGINEGIIDNQYTKRYFSTVFCGYYADWIKYILDRRLESAKFCLEFTTLVENWNPEIIQKAQL